MMKLLLAASVIALIVTTSRPSTAQTPDDPKIQRGALVYQDWCAPCHSSGRGNPGTAALAAKYKDRQPAVPAVLTDRRDLTPQAIRFFVRQGVSVMAPFRKTEISEADLEGLSAFLTRSKR